MTDRIRKNITALRLLLSQVEVFYPEKCLKNKRVVVIGAADTAFEEENGSFIEGFDVVIRINKALQTWKPEQEKFIGKRTDVLFHSFYENETSGGGPIDLEIFRSFGLQYLVHPTNSLKGYRVHLNFYKRHPRKLKTYLLSKQMYRKIDKDFRDFVPTTGYFALMTALNSHCKELYITGFTFFKTPYSQGYRDHLLDKKANEKHIKDQGLHDPDLEFKLFQKHLKNSPCRKIVLDPTLTYIIESADS